MFDTTVADGVCQLSLSPSGAGRDARWLVTGPGGGYRRDPAAYNVTVPEGFDRTDLAAYADERRQAAGFVIGGPALLTGVEMRHARGARRGPVTAVATVGLSNPVALADTGGSDRQPDPAGTVNLLLGTTRALSDGALGTLLATAVEVKAATLQTTTGFTGTTSDAVAVGSDPGGEPARFAGSATTVGRAARVCVGAAVRDALAARGSVPSSVAAADHGTVAPGECQRFRP
ncbi:MAG: adenosylcobinamide amidohydrolase [Salinirussus sp.]